MSAPHGSSGPAGRGRRVAVYNKYWSTGGGAEKYGGLVAQVLAADNDVVLLGPEDFDIDALADRLDLDLTGITNRVIAEHLGALRWASHEYDLVVNVSFMSHEAVRSRHSIYIVHFPAEVSKDLSGAQLVIGALAASFSRVRSAPGSVRASTRPGPPPHYFWASEDASFYVEPTPTAPPRCASCSAGADRRASTGRDRGGRGRHRGRSAHPRPRPPPSNADARPTWTSCSRRPDAERR